MNNQRATASGLVTLVMLSACSFKSTPPKAKTNQEKRIVVATQENSKYGLTATFYRLEGETVPGLQTFTHIAISNLKTGEEFVSEPQQVGDLSNVGNVWSADNEHLLLRRGNFEGMCILQASRVQNEIKTHPCEDFIRVYEKSTGTALVHSSGKWKTNDDFGFSVGLSGDSWDFSYNIKSKKLTVSGSATNFEGENSLGKVSLETK